MNYKFLVIYQKRSGEIIYRTLSSIPKYSKGDITSMGWKVLDIKNMYKGKTYTNYEYRTHLSQISKIKNLININNILKNLNVVPNMIFLFVCYKIFVN